MKIYWNEQNFFVLACLLCGLPVMLSAYPPMVDVPQHAAQIMALKDILFEGEWKFSNLFEIKPFTPYWLGYGLVMGLSIKFSIATSMKLVIASSQVLFVWAAARFCLQMGVPTVWRWAFLMLPFGFAYQWGFLNFIVAAPFGFIFLGFILTWRENLNKNNILKIIVFVHFLFFAHLLVAAFFCIIAVFLMAMPWRGVKVWIVRSLPIFSVIPIALAWIAIGFFTAPNASDPIIWLFGINRVIEFLPGLVSAPPNSIGFIIGAFFLILPWLYGATPRYSWVAWGPFFIYFFWMLLIPHYVGGNYFTYQRFGIFGLPLYCLGFEIKGKYISHNMKYIIKIGVAAIGILMIAWQCIRVDIFNGEIKEYQRVIHSAEPGQRMVMMIFDKMSRSNVSAPLMLHLAGWYQAEQHGLAEFNFARFWGMPLKYKDNIGPGIYSGFEWYPENFDWDKNDGENIQYLILRHPYDASAWISEKTYGNMSLLARDGPWQLYSKVKK